MFGKNTYLHDNVNPKIGTGKQVEFINNINIQILLKAKICQINFKQKFSFFIDSTIEVSIFVKCSFRTNGNNFQNV